MAQYNEPVSSVDKTSLSVRKVMGATLGPIKLDSVTLSSRPTLRRRFLALHHNQFLDVIVKKVIMTSRN